MNEDYPHIIETETETPKNTFPIIGQLGILAFVMVGIFGTFAYQNLTNTTPPPQSPANIVITTTQEPIVPQKIESVSIQANAAYVWDVAAQRALYSKNHDRDLPLASITKLMTALVAHELIESSDKTTITASAIGQEGDSGLLEGEQLGVNELSELALISSSNDAAYALAASVGSLLGDNDPAAQFVRGMNIRAEELNLNTLDFKNTTGLDLSDTEPGSTGSARDVSFLMEYIVVNNPGLLEPTRKQTARNYSSDGFYHDVENTNDIIGKIPNLIGSKTGYTDLAGGNLTIAFDAGLNRPIIVTVLGSTIDGRFTDVMTLVEAVRGSIGKQGKE